MLRSVKYAIKLLKLIQVNQNLEFSIFEITSPVVSCVAVHTDLYHSVVGAGEEESPRRTDRQRGDSSDVSGQFLYVLLTVQTEDVGVLVVCTWGIQTGRLSGHLTGMEPYASCWKILCQKLLKHQ